MNTRTNWAARRIVVYLCAVVCGGWMVSASAQEAIPKHLQVARDIVKNVKPDDNTYSNKPRYVRFPGDLFAGDEYTVRTDCTGLVEAVLDKAYDFAPKFSTRKFSYAYSIIDWVDGIDRGETFNRIERIQDAKPGDLIMWKYLRAPANNPLGLNGHIAIVNAIPKRLPAQRKPILEGEGIVQWEVGIIDSAASPMSHNDTRYTKNVSAEDSNSFKLTPRNGAGRGFIYIYTDEDGRVLAQAAGFARAPINRQDIDRRIVMARLRYNEIKK